MNVGQMRKLIEGLPDETPILHCAPDHSYRNPTIQIGTALRQAQSRIWTEDHGEELTPEAEYGKRVQVVIVS